MVALATEVICCEFRSREAVGAVSPLNAVLWRMNRLSAVALSRASVSAVGAASPVIFCALALSGVSLTIIWVCCAVIFESVLV